MWQSPCGALARPGGPSTPPLIHGIDAGSPRPAARRGGAPLAPAQPECQPAGWRLPAGSAETSWRPRNEPGGPAGRQGIDLSPLSSGPRAAAPAGMNAETAAAFCTSCSLLALPGHRTSHFQRVKRRSSLVRAAQQPPPLAPPLCALPGHGGRARGRRPRRGRD